MADFGLGKVLTTRAFGTATRTAGTPGFQSPEQLKNQDLGTTCDIYALGGVLTELFGGKPLWGDISDCAIMFKVAVEGIMPETDHLPAPIQHVVRNCLCPAASRETAVAILLMLCRL